jgi:class 3 adenylate cyclase
VHLRRTASTSLRGCNWSNGIDVFAGLQLVAALGDLKTTRAPLQTRVGIARGLVVVGDVIAALGM